MLHACEILFSESVRARILAHPNKTIEAGWRLLRALLFWSRPFQELTLEGPQKPSLDFFFVLVNYNLLVLNVTHAKIDGS